MLTIDGAFHRHVEVAGNDKGNFFGFNGVSGLQGNVRPPLGFRNEVPGFFEIQSYLAVEHVFQAIAGCRQMQGINKDVAVRRGCAALVEGKNWPSARHGYLFDQGDSLQGIFGKDAKVAKAEDIPFRWQVEL